MNYEFTVKWLKCFRDSSEIVCELYDDDKFHFSDPMLDYDIDDKPELLRVFVPFANQDRTNGIGVHNFRARGYVGDRRSGLILWEWEPEDCTTFMGMDATGRGFRTQGHTYHEYNDKGNITRESSWWDASAVLRGLQPEMPGFGPASPTKAPKGPAAVPPRRQPSAPAAADGSSGGLEHARRWCEALSNETEALIALYHHDDHALAEGFTSEHGMVDDNVADTLTTSDQLRQAYGPYSSEENGRYTFTATEWCGGRSDHGLIHWSVTIEGANTFRGLPVPEGLTLRTTGSTFQTLDEHGTICFESTYWEDFTIFQQLGIRILRPHYWEEGFDMEQFLAVSM
jgi:steroid delta-isomerase-like uncharacterized protein